MAFTCPCKKYIKKSRMTDNFWNLLFCKDKNISKQGHDIALITLKNGCSSHYNSGEKKINTGLKTNINQILILRNWCNKCRRAHGWKASRISAHKYPDDGNITGFHVRFCTKRIIFKKISNFIIMLLLWVEVLYMYLFIE